MVIPYSKGAALWAFCDRKIYFSGPMDVPGSGRIAQLLDPQGVMFALHEGATPV